MLYNPNPLDDGRAFVFSYMFGASNGFSPFVLWVMGFVVAHAMAPLVGLSLEQVTRVIGKKALKGDVLVTCMVKFCLTSTCLIFITLSSS